MENKKLVFVLSRFPWPCDNGQKGLISYWCKLFKEKLNLDVYLFFINNRHVDDKKIPSFISGFSNGDAISTPKKILNLFLHSIIGSWPMQTSIYFNKKNAKLLHEYCIKINPDFVVFDMIRLMSYSNYVNDNAVKIMNLSDMLSSRYLKNIYSGSNANLFGDSGEKGIINRLSNNKFLKKIALKFEAKKTFKAENKCSKMFDKIVFITENETMQFNNRTTQKNAYTVPIGVDFDYLRETKNDVNNNNLVFLGNLSYGPNYDSVKMICDKILPLFDFNFNMIFIGNCPTDLSEKYSTNNIIFTGRVEDIREKIGKSAIFLAPISYGTGIKTKIIEAMAMGKCVITNSIGAENIDAIDGTDFFVLDDFELIAKKISSLFNDRNRIVEIGMNAQKRIMSYYTFDNTVLCLKKIIE